MTSNLKPKNTPSSTSHIRSDADVRATLQAVNWDAILRTVRDKVGAASACWGKQMNGSYNLVRFLHLDHDEVVVRLPLYPDPEIGPMTPEVMRRNIRKTANAIASVEYAAAHTSIPVPRILHSCLDPTLDNVQSPYVVMTKVEGIHLSCCWDDMPDAQRDMVLAQVVDILLEMSTHRFDKIGSLFKAEDGSWRIESSTKEGDIPGGPFTSGTDQYMAITNARLEKIRHGRFGSISNRCNYVDHWFMRSLIPSLYENSLDAHGFPLMHGDFHSQNIFVVDADTHPRITAIIDWDDTSTISTSSFAQYPLFIVDHPMWDDDHPLRPRNVRDQASFNRLLEKAELKKFPSTVPRLSRAFAKCEGLYLFEQCIEYEYMYHILIWELLYYVFGPDALVNGWKSFSEVLESGILKDDIEALVEEAGVVREATKVLGDEVKLEGLSREEFIQVANKYKERFSDDGNVLPWLSRALLPPTNIERIP